MLTIESDSTVRTASPKHRRSSAGARPVWVRGMACAVAAVAAVSFVGAAVAGATPGPATAECLWNGGGFAAGSTVVAGGSGYTCTDQGGAPRWVHGAAVNRASTVANPGAAMRPAGVFSAGAVQPGTEYTDYCVGSQLIDGSESQYEVVADGDGTLFWKAAGPISQWTFDSGTGRVPSTNSASLCQQDPVLWPQN
ncbi:hypothetical protein AB0N05_02595 [Nocardia sp. NPDC051030]|uniref:hypothetical protein n=1 Tax=Nocardia sp. NPDC051030 TaxID=3155162 RepID=UPI00344A02C5